MKITSNYGIYKIIYYNGRHVFLFGKRKLLNFKIS